MMKGEEGRGCRRGSGLGAGAPPQKPQELVRRQPWARASRIASVKGWTGKGEKEVRGADQTCSQTSGRTSSFNLNWNQVLT
jgi:hypothetical protein